MHADCNITAAVQLIGSFQKHLLCLWLPMGVLDVPVAFFGATLCSLGSHWGDFGVAFPPLGELWCRLGCPWLSWAVLGVLAAAFQKLFED